MFRITVSWKNNDSHRMAHLKKPLAADSPPGFKQPEPSNCPRMSHLEML